MKCRVCKYFVSCCRLSSFFEVLLKAQLLLSLVEFHVSVFLVCVCGVISEVINSCEVLTSTSISLQEFHSCRSYVSGSGISFKLIFVSGVGGSPSTILIKMCEVVLRYAK